MLRIVLPEVFDEFITNLNIHSRKMTKLLKDRTVPLTLEAENLLKEMEERDLHYLFSNLTRAGTEGD